VKSDLAIYGNLKEGAFKKKPCVISFFPEEILLSLIDSAKQKSLKEMKKEQARNSGTGKIKASLTALSAIPEYVDSLTSMDREDLLKEDTRILNRGDIQKISFAAARELQSVDNGSTAVDSGKITIRMRKDRISFTHRREDKSGRISSYIKKYLS
jgi:hypothetical protein